MEKDHESSAKKEAALWDCDSSLYDSVELKSFKRQLDSAIASRTYSMPRLSDPVPPPPPLQQESKKPSKISKSIHRLLRSLFRMKATPDMSSSHGSLYYMEHGYYGVYPRYGALSTIPEVSEKGTVDSPEFDSVLRKTASERFTGTAGISCAPLKLSAADVNTVRD